MASNDEITLSRVKKRVDDYIKAMEEAWKIWRQYGKNPREYPPYFLGRNYRWDESFDISISFGHQPVIIVDDDLGKYKEMNPEMEPPWGCPVEAEYVNVSVCFICGKWKLVSGGTGCCEVCDNEIPRDSWESILAATGKQWMETKMLHGIPYSVKYGKTGINEITTYRFPDSDSLENDESKNVE